MSVQPPSSPRAPRVGANKRALLAGAIIAAAGLVFGGSASAFASNSTGGDGHNHQPPAISDTLVATPRSDAQIPNVTLVENQIKAYYGDTVLANGDHVPSATGNYAKQVQGIEADALRYLASPAAQAPRNVKKALVFDVDDTTLNTYDYEIFSSFAYNPTTNAEYVTDQRFPAVPGMPTLFNWAAGHGYTIFIITGRPEAQRAATEANLAKVGYQVPPDANVFLKNTTAPPAYLDCAATCTTDQYKAETRAHIESLGYDIVANFGDQYSDLSMGHEDRAVKIPNPMYFLP
jgi:hypothetical protein